MTKYLAPDSFKESMTASEVCQAMAAGIKKIDPKAEIVSVPMAAGGLGASFLAFTNARMEKGIDICIQVTKALKEGPKNVTRTTANIVRLLQKNKARA